MTIRHPVQTLAMHGECRLIYEFLDTNSSEASIRMGYSQPLLFRPQIVSAWYDLGSYLEALQCLFQHQLLELMGARFLDMKP